MFTKLTPGTLYLILLVIAIFAKVDHHLKITEEYWFNESRLNKILKNLKKDNEKDGNVP